jgi:hypothetical protein
MECAFSMLVRVAGFGIVLSVAAAAQIHGTRASATSFTGFSPFNHPAIPASATSLGPAGFNRGVGFNQGVGFGFKSGFGHARFRLPGQRVGFFPVGIPVAVPIVVAADGYNDIEPERIARTLIPDSQPQKVEITIVDRREEKREAKPEPAPAPPVGKAEPAPPEPELSPTIIVMSDGSRKELRNYAIMGKDLFDLAENKMFRIPLDSVNVDATVAANAANGKQFRLP